jgi:transposase-like protein
MTQRKCPQCNSELVQARHPENQGLTTGSSNYWRCSTCGSAFTAEQIRETKRPKPSAIEHA